MSVADDRYWRRAAVRWPGMRTVAGGQSEKESAEVLLEANSGSNPVPGRPCEPDAQKKHAQCRDWASGQAAQTDLNSGMNAD